MSPAALDEIAGYVPRSGLARHRVAASSWLSRTGLEVAPDRIIMTGGAHQAIVVALAGLVRPGGTLLAEALSYANLRGIAVSLGLRIEAVPLDEEGLRPDALDALCRQSTSRVLFIGATLHNPTATTLGEERRRAVVEVMRRHDALIIEDDVYGLLPAVRPPAFAALAPERTIHITSASKTLAPGLRVGMLACPPALCQPLADVKYDLFLSGPGVTAAVFEAWVRDGTADHLLARQRQEVQARHALAQEILGDAAGRGDPAAFHLWLSLPTSWRAGDFTAAAARDGVIVAPGHAFAMGRGHAPHAVRVSLGAAADRVRLRTALERLGQLLQVAPKPPRGLI
jgi:DNA-binding transcriptional MocR family regulator